MWKAILAVFAGIVGLFLIANLIMWGAGVSNIFYQEHLGVKQQNVQTKIFHGSQAWQDGQLQTAQQLWKEWNTAKDNNKPNTMMAIESQINTMIGIWPPELWNRCSPELSIWLHSIEPGASPTKYDSTTVSIFQ